MVGSSQEEGTIATEVLGEGFNVGRVHLRDREVTVWLQISEAGPDHAGPLKLY